MIEPGLEPQRIHITVRPRYGTLSEEERRSIIEALQHSDLGQVRIDEAIVFNLGLGGGPGGLPLDIEVFLNIGQQAAGDLLAVAIRRGIGPIVRILKDRIARLRATIRRGDNEESVRYVVDPPDESEAVDAIPADYEVTIKTESRTRVWRNGRWEHYESTTRTERGSAS